MTNNPQQIPKRIHQIWLGSPVPDHLKDNMATWRHHHPDWEYKLWDDDAIAAFGLVNMGLYQAARGIVRADAVGQFRADVARYEILHRVGGFYADADTVCRRSIDDAVAGRSTFAAAEDANWVGNTYLGCTAGNRVMERIISGLPANVAAKRGNRANKLSGPQYITPIWRAHGGHVDPTELWYPYSYSHVKNGDVPEDFGDAYAEHEWFHTRQVLRARGRQDV